MLETFLSCCLNMFCRLLKCVSATGRKDLVRTSVTSMFCVLWIGGEVAPELWQRISRSRVHGFNYNRT